MEDKNALMALKDYYLRTKSFNEGIKIYNKILEPEMNLIAKKAHTITEEMLPVFSYYKNLWHNEDLTDKTLFVFHNFAGLGDNIMFARYIPRLIKKTGKVIIEIRKNLIDLYKFNFPECEIIEKKTEEFKGQYDYTYHPELYLNFQTDLESFPTPEGYLKVNPDLIKKYTHLFNTEKKKVGIFWESESKSNRYRCVPTTDIIPILENQNCQFYVFNPQSPSPDMEKLHRKYNIIALYPYIKDAHDTAAMMKNMDLVISIDSFPIHLAGALGVKAYLMLSFDSEWRWFNDYDTTPWYDSVRIFKQNLNGNWHNVVQEISASLKNY